MKVLLVADSFDLTGGGGYGVSRHLFALSKFLAKQGVEVDLLTGSAQTTDSELSHAGVNVIRRLRDMENPNSLHWPFIYVYNSLKIARAISKYGESYDVVHYHGGNKLFLNSIKIRTPLISTAHGILAACLMYWGITGWCGLKPSALRCTLCALRVKKHYAPFTLGMLIYSKFFYNSIRLSLTSLKKYVCVSRYIENALKSAYRLDNLVTIHNFVDISEILQSMNVVSDFDAKSYLKVPNTMKLIVYSGRLSDDKGLLSLLDAFRLISKKEKNVLLIIIGDGPLRPYIKDVTSRLDNIILTGYLPRTLQLNLMSHADVFVAPSIYPDACPTTILEAMALGVPVVSTKVGGIPELVVNNKTGFLVRPDSPLELASKIASVLTEDNRLLKKNSIKRSYLFDITHLGKKVIDLYGEVQSINND